MTEFASSRQLWMVASLIQECDQNNATPRQKEFYQKFITKMGFELGFASSYAAKSRIANYLQMLGKWEASQLIRSLVEKDLTNAEVVLNNLIIKQPS